jgi:hypothetical protein
VVKFVFTVQDSAGVRESSGRYTVGFPTGKYVLGFDSGLNVISGFLVNLGFVGGSSAHI